MNDETPRSHNQGGPTLDDIGPGRVSGQRQQAALARSEADRLDAEARLIAAKSQAEMAAMGTIGRFIGDERRAALFGVLLLILVAFGVLGLAAWIDGANLPALVEVAKAVVYGGLGYIGARIAAPRRTDEP